MSEDWFDRSYRSDERPPADLDARILAAARRATRRWMLPAIAAGAFIIVAAAVLGFLVTGHELYVSPDDTPALNRPAGGEEFRIDVVQPRAAPGRAGRPEDLAPPGMLSEPGGIAPPGAGTQPAEGERPAATYPETDCRRSVLIGPLGGPNRRDLVQVCTMDTTVQIEIAWDGEPPCPSRLELDAPSGSPVGLERRELVIAESRYRCEQGRWVRSN